MNETRDVAVIVGSLHEETINRKVASEPAQLGPGSLQLKRVEIGHLPIYNQDSDDAPPTVWTSFRERIRAADAVLFVTSEHNRSMPAALKNAIYIGSRPTARAPGMASPARS